MERRREERMAWLYMRSPTRDRICAVVTEQMISDRVSKETFLPRGPICSLPLPLPIGHIPAPPLPPPPLPIPASHSLTSSSLQSHSTLMRPASLHRTIQDYNILLDVSHPLHAACYTGHTPIQLPIPRTRPAFLALVPGR